MRNGRSAPTSCCRCSGGPAAAGRGPLLVGFAAETEHVIEHASEKLRRKHLDLIVANDVSRSDAGFDVDTNQVTIISDHGAGWGNGMEWKLVGEYLPEEKE